MKHEHNAGVKVDLPTQDIEDLMDRAMGNLIVVIGFYMIADTARSVIKSALR